MFNGLSASATLQAIPKEDIRAIGKLYTQWYRLFESTLYAGELFLDLMVPMQTLEHLATREEIDLAVVDLAFVAQAPMHQQILEIARELTGVGGEAPVLQRDLEFYRFIVGCIRDSEHS
ncbi:MAG: hypothetical protein LBJ92_01900 [Holosporales bacterium]|nr:hypothetical protein [Holosporales bacterium]